MNKENYIKETERQLPDEQYYVKLTQDPSDAFQRDLKMLVKSFTKVDEDQMIKLTPQDSQPEQFYLLPKIHKPNYSERAIVSNKLTLTKKNSQYVEFYMKPYTQNANSFIQDTTHFLNKLKIFQSFPTTVC